MYEYAMRKRILVLSSKNSAGLVDVIRSRPTCVGLRHGVTCGKRVDSSLIMVRFAFPFDSLVYTERIGHRKDTRKESWC